MAPASERVYVLGARPRPKLLEMVGPPGEGRLTLALTWMAAAQPVLAAVVDWPEQRQDGHPATGGFYPPAAASVGLSLERLVIVRPPLDEPRAVLDAVAMLLRSEAFDVVLCVLPAQARISLAFGGKLASLAARAGTTLLLLTTPRFSRRASNAAGFGGVASTGASGFRGAGGAASGASRGALAAFVDYRVRITRRRWLWEDGEVAGMRLQVATERARAAAGQELGGAPVEHELLFRLHRRVRYGSPDAMRDAPAAVGEARGASEASDGAWGAGNGVGATSDGAWAAGSASNASVANQAGAAGTLDRLLLQQAERVEHHAASATAASGAQRVESDEWRPDNAASPASLRRYSRSG